MVKNLICICLSSLKCKETTDIDLHMYFDTDSRVSMSVCVGEGVWKREYNKNSATSGSDTNGETPLITLNDVLKMNTQFNFTPSSL